MNIVTGVLVYSITWWMVLFCVLPLGVERAEKVQGGNDPGAPKNPQLLRKVILTTLITAIVFAGIYALVASKLVQFPKLEPAKPMTMSRD